MKKLWTNVDLERLVKGLSSEDRLKRHNLRYACFRVQKEVVEGKAAEEEHRLLARTVELTEGFRGWEKFAVTWDISTPDPLVIVKRKWSIYQEWTQTMERVSTPFPGLE